MVRSTYQTTPAATLLSIQDRPERLAGGWPFRWPGLGTVPARSRSRQETVFQFEARL
jgi:hypothetical protein